MFKPKKQRARNFTEFEKNLLFEIVRSDYLNITENKKTDAVAIAEKNKAWEEITVKYNPQAQSGARNAKQLHALYDFLKKNAKSNLHHDKRQTGSAGFVPKSTVLDKKIAEILRPQALQNKFDSSSNVYYIVQSPNNDSGGYSNTATGANLLEESRLSESEGLDTVENAESCSTDEEKFDPLWDEVSEVNGPSSPNETVNVNTPVATSVTVRPSTSKTLPEKKEKMADILTNRVIKRKNTKDELDKELHEQKKRILDKEEEIKSRQLETLQYQAEIDKKIKDRELEAAEINLKLKKAQLEAAELEIQYKKKMYNNN